MQATTTDLSITAHLLRRAGFGARRDELEAYAAKGYEQAVDDLLNPERFPEVEEDVLERYYSTKGGPSGRWYHRMVNTERPLQEKMVVFWHMVFPTSQSKSGHSVSAQEQIAMFRRVCLTDMRTILTELSKDPAMIFWLDNNENFSDAPQRELRPGATRALLNGSRELHRGRRQGRHPSLLRLELPDAGSGRRQRPVPIRVRVPWARPRPGREVVLGRVGSVQR